MSFTTQIAARGASVRLSRKIGGAVAAMFVLLAPIAIAPWPLGLAGPIYGIVASMLSIAFFALAVPVGLRDSVDGDTMKPEKRLFAFSILYLFALFAALVVDAYLSPVIMA